MLNMHNRLIITSKYIVIAQVCSTIYYLKSHYFDFKYITIAKENKNMKIEVFSNARIKFVLKNPNFVRFQYLGKFPNKK